MFLIEVFENGERTHSWPVRNLARQYGEWDEKVKKREEELNGYIKTVQTNVMSHFSLKDTEFFVVFESKMNDWDQDYQPATLSNGRNPKNKKAE